MDKPDIGMTVSFSAEERIALRDIVRQRVAHGDFKKVKNTSGLPYHQANPGVTPIMKYFAYEHLPEELQKISSPICDIARAYDKRIRSSAEKSAGLRKLLEAKDCMVRAAL